jgi:hypothetical protein
MLAINLLSYHSPLAIVFALSAMLAIDLLSHHSTLAIVFARSAMAAITIDLLLLHSSLSSTKSKLINYFEIIT